MHQPEHTDQDRILRANAIRGVLTDRSGAITAGNTSQLCMNSNAARNYLLLQNISAGDLWFNFSIAAVVNRPSLKLAAGDTFIMESTYVSTEAVFIIGATTGQAFIAKEG